jgi:RNA polymerase sigma factor (sigma-70 family)
MEEIMEEKYVTINYKIAEGKQICVDVTSEVKELLEQSDRQIRSQRRQDRRYLIYTGSIDELENLAMAEPKEDIADLMIKKDSYIKLHAAIRKLSVVQQRRLLMYYFTRMTYTKIALIERVCSKTVSRSVERAINTLKKAL